MNAVLLFLLVTVSTFLSFKGPSKAKTLQIARGRLFSEILRTESIPEYFCSLLVCPSLASDHAYLFLGQPLCLYPGKDQQCLILLMRGRDAGGQGVDSSFSRGCVGGLCSKAIYRLHRHLEIF